MANLLSNTTVGGSAVITTSNIGSYALTSLPSHNHDDRYYTEGESDGRFLIGTTNPGSVGNFTLSIGNNGSYSYVQSHSGQALRLNPVGNPIYLDSTTYVGTMYANIIYDGNDSGYYLNPNGTSVLSYLTLNAVESLGVYGVRGKFTNEYIHLYNKVGIGHPGGWGQGEGNTPGFGLSTYGGANFAYGNNADSTFNGIVYSTASFRAPIFYDSQNTNYYGDFAGTSNLNVLYTNYLYIDGTQLTGTQTQLLKNTLDVTTLPYKVDITVNGDANTFYAVQFWGGDQDVWRRIIIKRGYGETAPWDPIGTGVHHGGLLLDWEGNFGGWGGAEYADRIRVFNESYTNVCADMFIYSHSMGYVFMLRGGGAVYHLFSDQPINGFYQSGAPDILYSTSTLSYDDTWSGTNQYDVPAPAPLSLAQVNSSRIDGLRTKKQSLLDNRYLRQGIDISGIGNITTTNSYATNFIASNAFYLNGTSYYLNSANGGIYTNARFETAGNLVVQGTTFLGNANGDEVHINDVLRLGATDSGDAHFFFGEGSSAGSDYGSHWYWDSAYTFNWYTRNAGTDTALFSYTTNDAYYVNWYRNFNMQNKHIHYINEAHFNGGTRFVSNNSNYLTFKTDSNGYGSIQVRDGDNTVRGYTAYFDGSGFGLLNSSGNWGIRLNPGNAGTLLYYAGSERLRTDDSGAYVTGRLDVSSYIYTPGSIIASNIQGGYQVLNLDTIKNPGLYQYDGGIGGTQPLGVEWSNVKTIEIGSDYRYSQFVMPYSNSRIFYRIKIDAGWQSYVELITSGNIGSQSVSYASTAGALSSMNISQFTNNSGYITSSLSSYLPLAGGTMSGKIFTLSTGTGTYDGAFEIRETSYVTTSQSAWGYAPGITYHWGGRVVSKVGLRSDGLFAIDDEPFATRSWTNSQGFLTSINSTQVTNALGYTPYNSSNPNGYVTSSGSVNYATTAGSAPNGSNSNQFYDVNAGVGNGLRFWNGSNAYKISMGVGSLYQYGPVSDYSIKMQMNDGDTGRGFVWGRESHAPIAALNSTSGDMEIAGYMKSYGYRGNGNVGGTGTASWHPDGIYCGSTMWQYGTMYKNGSSIYDVGELKMNGGPYLQTYNDRNLIVKGSSSSDAGIEGRNAAGSNVFQIYGAGSDYGFLNGTWGGWDIRKTKNSAMYMNNNDSYYLHTNSTSNFYALNIQGSAVVHAGNIGSQSVSYASSAGSVAWTNVSSRPTALSQFTNDLGNYGGWLTTGGKAADSELIDGIDSSRIVYGSGASKINSHSNANDWRDSGFYENDGGGSNWPSGTWYNSINVRHSNQGNYHGFQVAMSYYDNNLWFRSYQGAGTFQSWAYAISSQNIGSQSVNSATYATYLNPLSGDNNYKLSYTANGARTNAGEWGRAVMYYVPNGQTYGIRVDRADYADSAGSASQLSKYGDIYGDNWNTYYVSGKLIASAVLGMTGPNKPPTSYDYGVALSYGETGGPLMQWYFPENSSNGTTIFKKGVYRTGWNGNWSSWKTLVEQEGDLCTIVGGAGTGLEVHGNVGYNQDPLTYFLLRGQADTSWKSFKVRLTGDAGGQDIEFRRIAENGADSRMWYVPRGGNTVNFEYPIVQPSDSRLKDNITPISTPVEKIKALSGVEFDWNSGEQVGTHDVGLIAQDVEAVLPEAVTTQEDGYKNLAYNKVIPLLVEAMKEQQTMIEALKAEIELLKSR